jgi:spore coat protein H
MQRCLTVFLLVIISFRISAQHGDKIFDNTFVHEIRVSSSDPDFWIKLNENFNNTIDAEENIYIPANLVIDGTILNNSGFRIKGFTSAFSSPVKKPFRIDFNSFVKDQEYDGIKKLSLNNAASDPTMMRDVLAFNLFRTAGVAASRTSFAKVYINNEYWGLYILVEQVDKVFVTNHLKNGSGNLFKCGSAYDLSFKGETSADYKRYLSLKTNETKNDWSGFINFVKHVNQTEISEDEFYASFPDMFDIDTFLKVLAIDVLLLNWDSYYDHGRNWYLYENTDIHKFTWIPWDYNYSFSDLKIDVLAEHPIFMNTPKPLIRNLLKNPEYQKLLGKAYSYILQSNFTKQRLYPLIEQYEQLITSDLLSDHNKFYEMETFHKSLDQDVIKVHEDTFKMRYQLDQVFIIQPNQPIPDSVFTSGLIILDTTWASKVILDTVLIDNVQVVFIECHFFNRYEEKIIGLKSFISRRIIDVKQELLDLDLWVENVVAVEEDVPDAITVFPNPASDILSISFAGDLNASYVEIVDVNGKQVHSELLSTTIDVSNLPPGLYLLQITVGKTIHRKRFIRE